MKIANYNYLIQAVSFVRKVLIYQAVALKKKLKKNKIRTEMIPQILTHYTGGKFIVPALKN
jgi:hypothetical protein